MRSRLTAATVTLLVLALPACSSPRPEVLPPPPDTGPAPVYVAVGASETTGVGSDQPLRDAWPRVLHRTALPPGSVFVNMGIPGATVAQALAEEMSPALQVRPDLVTVWLNVNDMVRGVSPAEYERQLDTLVKALRRDGATRVLVANTPPLDRLPAFLAGRNLGVLPSPEVVVQLTAAYNAAVARVAERQGALLVDLHAVGVAARAAGTEPSLVSADGFHPSTAGHAAVGAAFAEVLKSSGPLLPPG
jgi:lysophospholipase L1-like esterase